MEHKTREFLYRYKELEEFLTARYDRENRHTSSAVYTFAHSREGAPFREDLDLCREIRNLLSHRSDIDGEPIVEPASGLIEVLDKVLSYVKQPPRIIEYATPAKDLLQTSLKSKVYELMRFMEKRGYSHVPVVQNGTLIGVFSVSTLFSYQLSYPDRTLRKDALLGDLAEFLPISCHCSETFHFLSPDATFLDAQEAFEVVTRGKRLAAIFLTQDGTPKGKLLGMVTPWDVLGKSDNQEEE